MHNYAPDGKYLWDTWFIKKGAEWHVFYLQADRSVSSEGRHDIASIGHAVSENLTDWKELPTALTPAGGDAWDGLALWTGSIIEKGGTYYLFYTGRAREKSHVQRIGLATSTDLIHWERHGTEPLLVADPRYYEMQDSANALGMIGAWRDPFVFKDPKSDTYYMTISARKSGPKQEYNGCIALAASDDLLRWEVREPIFAPGRYDEMETSQLVLHEGLYYLFFSVGPLDLYAPNWRMQVGEHTGLHCYWSHTLFGDYQPVNGDGVVLERSDKLYAVRLLESNSDTYTALGWLNRDSEGNFIGKLTVPFEIVILGNRVVVPPDQEIVKLA